MKLPKPESKHRNPFADVVGTEPAPAGTFVATIVDIHDEEHVERTKYQSPETEIVDLTTFLFGFRDADGVERHVASQSMRVSGHEKSRLYGLLRGILGHAPDYGWDYRELRGIQCLLTIEHKQRRDGNGVFASVAAASPLPAGWGATGAVESEKRAEPIIQPSTTGAPQEGSGVDARTDDGLPF